MNGCLRLFVLLLLCRFTASAPAHPLAPALFAIDEQEPGHLIVSWKTPRSQSVEAGLFPVFPEVCTVGEQTATQRIDGSGLLTRFELHCSRPLAIGDVFAIEGLESSPGGGFLRFRSAQGHVQRQLLHAGAAEWQYAPASRLATFANMVGAGFDHLTTGWDHLLLIACLVLLSPALIPMLVLLTAFTVGHSLTLALVAGGWLNVPQAWVEACIALSIVWVAAKLAMQSRGARTSQRVRWWVCLLIGLLHGMGFAGALSIAGVASVDMPAVLLGFNLGIELAQVVLVLAILLGLRVFRRLRLGTPGWARQLPAYAAGSVASFWLFSRMAAVLS